jgi:hypothetical protein
MGEGKGLKTSWECFGGKMERDMWNEGEIVEEASLMEFLED